MQIVVLQQAFRHEDVYGAVSLFTFTFYSLDRTKFVKNAWRTIRFAQLQILEKENARQQNNRNKIRRQNENCKNLLCAALL